MNLIIVTLYTSCANLLIALDHRYYLQTEVTYPVWALVECPTILFPQCTWWKKQLRSQQTTALAVRRMY